MGEGVVYHSDVYVPPHPPSDEAMAILRTPEFRRCVEAALVGLDPLIYEGTQDLDNQE